MPITITHHWHVSMLNSNTVYHPDQQSIKSAFRSAGFSVNPLPGRDVWTVSVDTYTVGHTNAGAMTLFMLQHPEVFEYISIQESSCAGV